MHLHQKAFFPRLPREWADLKTRLGAEPVPTSLEYLPVNDQSGLADVGN